MLSTLTILFAPSLVLEHPHESTSHDASGHVEAQQLIVLDSSEPVERLKAVHAHQ
jgi:hypothetical protein